ncbi:hypothetical protein CMI37_29490 [Candidatus Pacearchaeota archaeon]|nr:hypothetical protein [Candidatus Pacearchaeota archaeon]
MAARTPHIIRGNKGNSIPSHVVVITAETRRQRIDTQITQDTFITGWTAYARRYGPGKWSAPGWQGFKDTNAFWDSVVSHCAAKRRVYLFGYDLGRIITVSQGFEYFTTNGWENTSRILGKAALALTFKRDGAALVLVDTVNLFRASPEEMAETFGLDIPAPVTGKGVSTDTPFHAPAQGQVLLTALIAWFDLIKSQDLGNFAITLAAQAMAAYRHRFMFYPIFINATEESQELSREGYYGGRSEAYQLGEIKGEVYGLDINSMFPSIMAREPAPVKLLSTYRRPTLYDMEYLAPNYALVARVDIETLEPVYPKRHQGRTMFPVGPFTTVLNTPELIHALAWGRIKAVHKMYVYDQRVIFSEYVEHFWALRAAAQARGDTLTAGLAKSFLNSLYGKFGQKGQIWKVAYKVDDMGVRYWSEWDVEEQLEHQYRQLLGVVEEYQDETESKESFPAISAHITAYARMYLWSLMELAGRENVYYCDTDSLFVNTRGYQQLAPMIAPGQLGKLRVDWQSDRLVIHGIKDYTIGDRRRIKGVMVEAVEVSPGVFVQPEVRGFAGMIRDGDMGRRLITDVEKVLRRDYQKGKVDPSGKVRPLRIPQ